MLPCGVVMIADEETRAARQNAEQLERLRMHKNRIIATPAERVAWQLCVARAVDATCCRRQRVRRPNVRQIAAEFRFARVASGRVRLQISR